MLMYEFWYDYLKPKYRDKARLCYKDTDSFVIYIKTEDITKDAERWINTSTYYEKDDKPFPIGKNKKVIGLFKDQLGGKNMTEFVALRAKTYAYLTNDYNDDDYDKNKIEKWKSQRNKKVCNK